MPLASGPVCRPSRWPGDLSLIDRRNEMQPTLLVALAACVGCLLVTIRYYEKALDRARRDCARHRHPSLRASL